jgi:branched-chain amino acid transport system permease protein
VAAPRVDSDMPCNAGRWAVWGGYALLLVAAPLVFDSGLARSLLSQMGIAIIACLAYNMLLGQGGMLSFGHAVYSGLASFVTVHLLNRMADGWPLPVSLLPLAGGLAGMGFALLLGYLSTRRAGTAFAMITLGLGELVFAMSLMVPEFFGGEAGVSADRVVGDKVLGIGFGPQIEVYYLIAAYTFACTAAMYAFTRTPLGRLLEAVRDNPERIEYLGFCARTVRWLAFVASGFFAGVAGGLYTLNFEIVTAEVVGAARSGAYLLFTFLGGVSFFFGPVIGGVLMVMAVALLPELSQAWPLWLGLIFLFMVMVAPGGIASLVMMNLRVARHGLLGPLLPAYVGLAATLAVALAGAGAAVEMLYHLQLQTALDDRVRFLGLTLDARSPDSWVGAALLCAAGAVLFEVTRREFLRHWDRTQQQIEARTRRGSMP